MSSVCVQRYYALWTSPLHRGSDRKNTEMVLTSKWGRIQPEIQIWPDQVGAGSRTGAGSLWTKAEMLSELRSPMTPSSPAVACCLRDFEKFHSITEGRFEQQRSLIPPVSYDLCTHVSQFHFGLFHKYCEVSNIPIYQFRVSLLCWSAGDLPPNTLKLKYNSSARQHSK